MNLDFTSAIDRFFGKEWAVDFQVTLNQYPQIIIFSKNQRYYGHFVGSDAGKLIFASETPNNQRRYSFLSKQAAENALAELNAHKTSLQNAFLI